MAEKIEIRMSKRAPISIDPNEWPVIASSIWHDGHVEVQANNIRKIKVREHKNGRRIVYGFQHAGNGGQFAGTRNPFGGFLIEAIDGHPDEAETIRTIERIGEIVGDDDLANECIADMPLEEV